MEKTHKKRSKESTKTLEKDEKTPKKVLVYSLNWTPNMQRKQVNLDQERKILINMILSTEFLKSVAPVAQLKYFKSSYSRVVASWVLEYYQEYGAAPGKHISDIYFDKRKHIEDEEDVGIISRFLESLSTQNTIQNTSYTISQTIQYLKQRSLEEFTSEVKERIESASFPEAEQLIASYARVEEVRVRGIDIINDLPAVLDAFNSESEELFRLTGALSEACGSFNRGDFVSFLAFMKRGKSYALDYVMECAAMAGLCVVKVSLEMTDRQNLRREWMSFTGRPRITKKIRLPYFEETSQDGKSWEICYENEVREGIPRNIKELETLKKEMGRLAYSSSVRLITLPSRSITTQDLETHLTNLEHFENIVPDVLIVDYADLLDSKAKGDYRHKIDDIWANLRGLALRKNICVVTASQSTRFSANADLSEESVAEDIRKLAHVTRMIGINQSKKDKENQIYRFHVLAEREGDAKFDEVLILACLDIGRLVIDSHYVKEVVYEKEKQKIKKAYT